MASELVMRAEEDVRDLETAIDEHSEPAAEALDTVFLPYLEEGEVLPDFRFLFALLGRALAHRRQEMIAADQANFEETAGDSRFRQQRQGFYQSTRTSMLALRGACEQMYGVETSKEVVPVRRETGTTPRRLVHQAEHTLGLLRRNELPPPLVEGIIIDRDVWIKRLEPQVRGLRENLEALEVEDKRAQVTVGRKDEAMATIETLLGNSRRAMRAFLIIGSTVKKSLARLAERLVSTRRRSSSPAPAATTPEPSEPPETPEAPDASATTEATTD